MANLHITSYWPKLAAFTLVGSMFIAPISLGIAAKTSVRHEVLFGAAISCDKKALKRLLRKGIDINIKSKDGNTALMTAASWGCKSVAKFLIEKGADVNLRNKYGKTAFLIALEQGYVQLARLLLNKGTHINLKCSEAKWTPLHIAAYHGYVEIVRLLLNKGVKTDCKTDAGQTALILATLNAGTVRMAPRITTSHGGPVRQREKDPLIDHAEVVNLLLKRGANVKLSDEEGNTALDYAAKANNTGIAQILRRYNTPK